MPTDATDISDDDCLWRRVTPGQQADAQPDGTYVLKSFAFKERTDEFSLYVAREITIEKLLSCGFPTQIVVQITAGDIRSRGYVIIRDPDLCDASHVYALATRAKTKNEKHEDRKVFASEKAKVLPQFVRATST